MAKKTDTRIYGWQRDLPDFRDLMLKLPAKTGARLPTSVNLCPQMPPVYDQGNLGSCTANAVGALVQYERRRQGFQLDFTPSRLFLYYNERVLEHTVNNDSGAAIRDAIKAMVQWGDCPETEWDYMVDRFTAKPSPQCYSNALKYRALRYERVEQTLTGLKRVLALGNAIAFGFSVFHSFESEGVAKTGQVSLPSTTESALGGHAVLLVGYDNSHEQFIVRNSWGPDWGMHGYCTMPYAYLTNTHLAADFWTITSMSA